MRKVSSVFAAVLMFSFFCWSQTAVPSKAYPVKRVAPHSPAHPTAVIDTTAGKLNCVLFPDKAPIGVANFVGLSKGTKEWTDPVTGKKKTGVPLYNGTIFHRVIPDFMIQGGDPKGDGTGDPGYKFKNEVSPDLLFDQPGRLAYANAGPDTNGSQFFVTEGAYPSLNGGYTIFGQCDDASVVLVKQIARMARDSSDRPYQPVKINQITIGNGVVAHKPAAASPVRKKAASASTKPQQ
jgi:peptidyl-prolyl cis-trans isomerase A (cyclophilin A)